MDAGMEYPYCPVARQLCRAGRVWVESGEPKQEATCVFWHRKELRCVVRMAEFDLFNIARALDELRNR
jgi:hypothetical protein